MMQGYERSKIKVGNRPAVEQEREIVLPDQYRLGGPDRVPMTIRAFDPDRPGAMIGYMRYKKGGLHKAANQVRAAGRHDDTMLIHVNEDEFRQMREMFGDPIINPETGLPEYGFLKSLKKAFRKIAPVLSVASLFVPGLSVVGKLASGLTKAGLNATLANTVAGATVGGLTGGTKGAITGGLGGFASTPGAAQNIGKFVPGVSDPALQTAIGRGVVGAAGAGLTGQDPLTGALTAAGTGYAADQLANSQFVQQTLRGSPTLQQGALGALQGFSIAGQTGGDLGKGALYGGALGAATSAADAALARFKAEPQPTLAGGYAPPNMPGAQAPAQPLTQQVQAGVQANLAPVISNLMSRPDAASVIAQASQAATKTEALQAAAPMAANPDTRPVYDAMSNFRVCDNAPHFGACFAQNWGTFMQSIAQNSPKVMPAKMGGLARYAQGGYVDGGPARLALGGPGDGQDDLIRTQLEDGDFIVPADVVSALGSGSTNAGLAALEDMVLGAIGEDQIMSGTGSIEALVSDGEFRVPRAAVMALGGGSVEKGADVLYDMMERVRSSYRSAKTDKIPPKAKSPLAYMGGAK